MKVIYGREALEKLVGKDHVRAVRCVRKYPGQKKATPRADWWPYCYAVGDDWVVACEEPQKLEKSARWADAEGVGVARRWGSLPAPFAPSSPVYHPSDWTDFKPTTLALDVEGELGTVTRISVATDNQCGTFSWDEVSKQLTQLLVSKARKIIGWNLAYDMRCLAVEGVKILESRAFDLMTAHKILNPWRIAGLGHAAPLYAPLQAWKHFDEGDMEEYALRDAANLIPIYHEMLEQLKVRRQLKHYVEIDMPSYFKLERIGAQDVQTNRGYVSRRFVARRRGKESPETVAAWLMESHPRIGLPGSPEGKPPLELDERYSVYRIGDAYRRIISSLAGQPLACDEHMVRMVMGYGPKQAYSGSADGLSPLPTERTMTQLKQDFAKLMSKHPKVDNWIKRLKKQRVNDGFVVNPFGRRCYVTSKKQPQRWVVESTLADTLRLGMDLFPQSPVHLVEDGWVFLDPVDVAACLQAIHFPLESLKRNLIGGLT